MLDFIRWYGVELYLRLVGRVDPLRLPTIVQEATSHLEESAKAIQAEAGLKAEEASLEAIRLFGSPAEIAAGFLSRSPGRIMGAPAGLLVAVCAVVSSICFLLNLAWLDGFFDNFGDTWQNVLSAIVAAACLALMFAACRARQRSSWPLLTLVSCSTAIATVFVLSFWMIGDTGMSQGVSRFHRERDVARLQGTIKEIARQENLMRKLGQVVLQAKAERELPLPVRDLLMAETTYRLNRVRPFSFRNGNPVPNHFVVPSFVIALVDGRVWAFDAVPTFAEAKQEWRRYATVTARMESTRQNLCRLLFEAKHPRLLYMNPRVYSEPAMSVLIFLPVLLFVDALARLSRRVRDSRVRLWA